MLYAQDSKRFIAAMEPKARLRLKFKALWKVYSKILRGLKHSKLNRSQQSYEYTHKKMIITEQYLRNGIPRTLVYAMFKELGI